MKKQQIKGLQKVTLVDYPKKIACTIFLFGCDFRCSFCHNPELVIGNPNSNYTEDEIFEFLETRRNSLDGVCITGGEPLLTVETEFLEKIKKMGYLIKVDTNGNHPERLQELIDLKLIDFVAMDIKSSPEKYDVVSCSKVDLKNIEETIRIVSRLPEYEFRTTVLEGIHTLEEIRRISEWLGNLCEDTPKRFVLQGFKNSGKFIDQKHQDDDDTSEEFLKELKDSIADEFLEVEIRV